MHETFDIMALTLALPILGAFLIGTAGDKLGKRGSAFLGSSTVALSFLITMIRLEQSRSGSTPRVVNVNLWEWLTFAKTQANGEVALLKVNFGLLIDPLSLTLMSVITGVGFLIHWYSSEYMENDPGVIRYFCLLNIFIAAMTLLVLANNFATLIIGWGGVGFASFALIGFWREKPSAAAASKKAFVMNVIGDVGLMMSVFLLFWNERLTSLEFRDVFEQISTMSGAEGWLTAVAIGLMVGAFAKSAQAPLHTWLPDAMEGPTPVSALIHAATMVTAGVYLLVRCHPILTLVPSATTSIAWFGAFTALLAACCALVQTDLKRVLAYSTMSQLGYMFIAVGVGAYGAAVFHLVTHAFFKALLFLAAGIVIHAAHGEQNMNKLGGLRKELPTTAAVFAIGGLALAGFPLTSGFFSKEAILHAAHHSDTAGATTLFGIGAAVAVMTAFYTGRAYFLTFHGKPKIENLHLPGGPTTFSCLILAVLAGGSGMGYPLLSMFLDPDALTNKLSGFVIEPGITTAPAIFLSLLVIAALGLAYKLYSSDGPDRLGEARWKFLREGLGFDEIYGYLTAVFVKTGKFCARAVDRFYQELLPDFATRSFLGLGEALRESQTGQIRHYMVAIVIAVVFLLYCSMALLGGTPQ